MKKVLMIGMVISNLLFADWGSWEKTIEEESCVMVNKNTGLNDKEVEFLKLYREGGMTILVFYNAHDQFVSFLNQERPYLAQFEIDDNEAIKLIGEGSDEENIILFLDIIDPKVYSVIEQMKKGNILKITLVSPTNKISYEIPLENFLKIYNEL